MDDVWVFYSGYMYEKRMENGYIKELAKKAKEKYNINLVAKNIHEFVCVSGETNEIYYEGKLVTQFPKYAILRRYEIYLSRQLEKRGVEVFNSSQSMVDARNKLKTHQMLSNAGVPTPKTLYIVPKINCKNVLYETVVKYLGEKFIVKWLYGSQGTHVYLVESEEEFQRLVTEYSGKILCQEYIEKSFGMDIRAYVLGGKFIGAGIRKSNSGDFRSNLAKGGEALKLEDTSVIEEMAVKAAKVSGLAICGVDILIGEDKYYVCEVNAIPGFKTIHRTTGIDEKDILLQLIKNKMEEK